MSDPLHRITHLPWKRRTPRRRLVFVDPDDSEAPYWWPAMVVANADLDLFYQRVNSTLEPPKPNEHLVCYFEDGSYSVVPETDTRPFDPHRSPYTEYLQGPNSHAFKYDRAVQLATLYFEFAQAPGTFLWICDDERYDSTLNPLRTTEGESTDPAIVHSSAPAQPRPTPLTLPHSMDLSYGSSHSGSGADDDIDGDQASDEGFLGTADPSVDPPRLFKHKTFASVAHPGKLSNASRRFKPYNNKVSDRHTIQRPETSSKLDQQRLFPQQLGHQSEHINSSWRTTSNRSSSPVAWQSSASSSNREPNPSPTQERDILPARRVHSTTSIPNQVIKDTVSSAHETELDRPYTRETSADTPSVKQTTNTTLFSGVVPSLSQNRSKPSGPPTPNSTLKLVCGCCQSQLSSGNAVVNCSSCVQALDRRFAYATVSQQFLADLTEPHATDNLPDSKSRRIRASAVDDFPAHPFALLRPLITPSAQQRWFDLLRES
ncbi:hypothetical protein IWQ62_000076 [Dispira parvispora]|uniref:PWWP domain-containing protein n=1 Tax=Dispira parvispora TaxID=1520584 RepID=A0A9W8AWS0_9FUNG|nr:hypothetical protein IWQ62_000076 [Dispira parvispora]